MEFPSLLFIESLQEALNKDSDFNRVTKWSDVKVLLSIGERQYWFKLYGGEVIDVMEYHPLANPLGWDYMISGDHEVWTELRKTAAPKNVGAALLNSGRIRVDGNMLQANRMYESTFILINKIREITTTS